MASSEVSCLIISCYGLFSFFSFHFKKLSFDMLFLLFVVRFIFFYLHKSFEYTLQLPILHFHGITEGAYDWFSVS